MMAGQPPAPIAAAFGALDRAGGPWALLRLIDSARLEQTGQPDRFRVSFGGGEALVEIEANSVVNPFRSGLLDRFRCPLQL